MLEAEGPGIPTTPIRPLYRRKGGPERGGLAKTAQQGFGAAETGHGTPALCLPPSLPHPLPLTPGVESKASSCWPHSSGPGVLGDPTHTLPTLRPPPAPRPGWTCGLDQLGSHGWWLRPQSHNRLGVLIEEHAWAPWVVGAPRLGGGGGGAWPALRESSHSPLSPAVGGRWAGPLEGLEETMDQTKQ